MSKDIDWSKAPEWAYAHGLHETGFGIKEFWLGETQHQNLEHAKSFPYGGGDPSCGSFHNSRRESFSYVTLRPAPWVGEGLPPVGVACEVLWNEARKEYTTCIVIGVEPDTGFPVFRFTGMHKKNQYQSDPLRTVSGMQVFRPIRTPEQIEAEEREAAVTDIALIMGKDPERPSIREKAAITYDAGYRKQVAQ